MRQVQFYENLPRLVSHSVQSICKPGRGVFYARNAGWRSANSDIIDYIDDDCYPAEDFVDALFNCFSKDPRLGFVGGRIILHDFERSQNYYKNLWNGSLFRLTALFDQV